MNLEICNADRIETPIGDYLVIENNLGYRKVQRLNGKNVKQSFVRQYLEEYLSHHKNDIVYGSLLENSILGGDTYIHVEGVGNLILPSAPVSFYISEETFNAISKLHFERIYAFGKLISPLPQKLLKVTKKDYDELKECINLSLWKELIKQNVEHILSIHEKINYASIKGKYLQLANDDTANNNGHGPYTLYTYAILRKLRIDEKEPYPITIYDLTLEKIDYGCYSMRPKLL